jgi:hypothetical protein
VRKNTLKKRFDLDEMVREGGIQAGVAMAILIKLFSILGAHFMESMVDFDLRKLLAMQIVH